MWIRDTFNAYNRYLKRVDTCYKTCNLFYDLKILLFCKNGGTPFLKNEKQRISPNFVHFVYLIFGRISLRRKFCVIPLRCNTPPYSSGMRTGYGKVRKKQFFGNIYTHKILGFETVIQKCNTGIKKTANISHRRAKLNIVSIDEQNMTCSCIKI